MVSTYASADSEARSHTFPGYRGSHSSSTLGLAALLRAKAATVSDPACRYRLSRAATRLERCAKSSAERWGWRCGQPICPRCECRKAIHYRERLEGRLRKPGTVFKHVTATVAAADPWQGQAHLRAAFGELKRRVVWTAAVAGGEAHLQVKPSEPGSVRAFNVHFHAVVELRPGRALDAVRLSDQWCLLLARRGAAGSLAVTGVERHWAVFHG